ncbi:pectin lyase-like protein [Coccomyxa subellipsoidea C-169]|uniref:Pectin lyase-like protein n=1 Tax=Coccomyxa subellipsoidea (strain C-169) TaxID=574566 RepID=I0YT07_COCSC|nr:pectin lyase-like protein [Coccomyxa subellipsoidea C-169]EIE21526.1 pectin lyase-like protein [Coccomyxa subellipsoidea C-169]|eukprot:XP_005646070.1 pectin lyase-like protein [Coccomyxa subellipsoidea C-169]
MVNRVTQSLGMASVSQPSDPLEYAAQGRGMLTYHVGGVDLDGEAFRKFWVAAHKNKAVDGIRIPPGEYHIKPPEDGSKYGAHLYLACNEDGDDRTSPFVLDLSNTFLWLTSKDQGAISIDNGENVELRGPFAVCNNLDSWSFAQATLVSFNEEKLEWIVHGHDGYPNDRVFLKDGSVNAIIWDPATRLMKDPDVHDFGTRSVEKIGPNQYKFTLSHTQDYNVRPGDYITARSADGCSAINLECCKRCTVHAATIHTASCFGFYDAFGTANVYRDCFLLPYPRPIGNDGQLPLLSTNADGIHATDNAEGPRLINCFFGGLGDDAIAVTGHFSPVATACPEEKYIIVLQVRRYMKADKGEPVQAYSVEGASLGTATIASVEECDNPLPGGTKLPNFCIDDGDKQYCTKITVEEWPESWGGIGQGCGVQYPTWCGNGYQAVGCRVFNTRGRAVLAKGSRGLIADNTFTHLKGAGVQLTPEYNCLEAGFVCDVTVRNNTIDSLAPGIWVGGSTTAEGDSPPAPFHHNRNIVIENNVISHSWKTPFIVTSSENVTVRGNTFRNCLPRRTDVEWDTRIHSWEVDAKLMLFKHVKQLTLGGNRFVKDEPRDFRGNYEDPMEFDDCSDVVHEPDTNTCYNPAYPYPTYPTSTS